MKRTKSSNVAGTRSVTEDAEAARVVRAELKPSGRAPRGELPEMRRARLARERRANRGNNRPRMQQLTFPGFVI
jgi:hypothetical protein